MPINDRGGIVLDQSIFYPTSGGQPGDTGTLTGTAGTCPIATTVYDADREPSSMSPADVHRRCQSPATRSTPELWTGTAAMRHMRMHTALHLLCSLIPFSVTGGSIGDGDGRLDFDIEDAGALDKDDADRATQRAGRSRSPDYDALDQRRRTRSQPRPGAHDGASSHRWAPARSDLSRSARMAQSTCSPAAARMSASTGEIGPVAVTKIEKKGRQNRRVRVAFA